MVAELRQKYSGVAPLSVVVDLESSSPEDKEARMAPAVNLDRAVAQVAHLGEERGSPHPESNVRNRPARLLENHLSARSARVNDPAPLT